MFKIKKQGKTSENNFSEMEMSNSPDKEFKAIVIKRLTELGEEWINTVRTSTRKWKM